MSKKLFGKIFILLLVVGLLFAAAPTGQALAQEVMAGDQTWYGDGSATVFTLMDVADLEGLDELVTAGTTFAGKTINLGANLNLSGTTFAPIGTATNTFNGTFDGGNYTVSNLTVIQTTESAGLFAASESASFKNLTLSGFTITAPELAGGLIGTAMRTNLDNIHITNSTITTDHFGGGIVGYIYGNFSNSSATNVTVKALGTIADEWGNKMGGLIGYAGEGGYLIQNNTATNAIVSGIRGVGGIAGAAQTDNKFLNNQVVGGTVSAVNTYGTHTDAWAGGVIGQVANPYVYLFNNTSTATVTSYDAADAGQIIGGPVANAVWYYIRNSTQDTYFSTIQAAINAADPGDTIEVAAGDYNIPSTITLAKAVTITGPTTGEAKLIKTDGSVTNNIFLITTSNVTIQNLTLTLNGAPTVRGDAFIQAPDGAKTNIQILNNKIYVDQQAGPMTDWNAQAIYFGRYTTNSKISNNTIYNTRSGAVAHYNCEVEYRDNVIYNTKGGIMNYASDAANALERIMVNNSWGTVHNEWDIVWNSGAGVWDFDENDLVLQMSQENNDAYVVTQIGTAPILGNRSHVFVNAVTGTETLHPSNGNMNLPYKKIQDAMDAVVPGGTIYVAAGTYNLGAILEINKEVNILGEDKATTFVKPTASLAYLFTVNSGGELNLSNFTIDGEGFASSGAIRINAGATGVIDNNVIKNFIKPGYQGFGIVDYGNNAVISNNTFSNIGRVGMWIGGTGVQVTGNTYTGKGAGDWLDYGIEVGMGGTATISGNTISNCLGVASDGSESGAVIATTYYGAGTSATLTNNTFSDSSYGIMGGYDETDTSIMTATGNIFTNIPISVTLTNSAIMDLVSTLAANTFPTGSAIVGNNIMIPPTKLLMDPATFATTDTCTGEFVVDVMVQNVTALQSYEMNIQFDNTRLEVTKVENQLWLTTPNGPSYGNTFGNDTGLLKWGWVSNAPSMGVDPATFTGSGPVIKITFEAKALAGTGAFTILGTSYLGEWPNAFGIPYEITGGTSVSFGTIVTNTTQTKSYCDLATAVTQAAGGDTLRVDVNFTIPATVTVDKALTLDLNGKVATYSPTDNSYALSVNGTGAALTVKDTVGTGKILVIDADADGVTDGRGISVIVGSLTLDSGTIQAPYAGVYVRPGTSMVMNGGTIGGTVDPVFGIVILGTGSSLDINGGTIEANDFAVSGNATPGYGDTTITIDGGTLTSTNSVAIYHPQTGNMTITAGTITGTNGIEVNGGGLLNITGGTINATGAFTETPLKESGKSTNSGDAILIYSIDGGYTGTMNVTISGGSINSANNYALREVVHPGSTSRLGVVAISGGHFTGTPGAVSFTTVSDANLDLTAGDYSHDPIAYVYAPSGTYLNTTDNRWYISPLPVLSSTDFDDQVTLGVPTTFELTVDPSVPGAFGMVFTGYPSETEITYGGATYSCVMTGDPQVCTITVPVTLTGAAQTLPFAITVATAGTETPAASYAVTATLHAPTYDAGAGRDLDSLTVTVPVTPGFTVSGTVTMQGRTTRAGVPVFLTWNNTLGVTYGPHMDTDEQAVNFRLAVNYGGTYTITTLQLRYLNITTDLAKNIAVNANYTFTNPLWLRAGDAYMDNVIDSSDTSLVGTQFGTAGETDPTKNGGDVNFDGIVNIKDLALVGGNMFLTSAAAYGTWIP